MPQHLIKIGLSKDDNGGWALFTRMPSILAVRFQKVFIIITIIIIIIVVVAL